ncbi:thymidylate kinase [Parabacteroides sp. PFB2-12]|uniref:hypothetical protein n=1 Tax=unclassified Parabacteroides TaxID=2649774 RepID=UPI00247445FE|nr:MULTISPECIES: hypothetical protein [unclassified Parabacteroides]MDH6342254.1 energy-coupling factor transporter ATP-binding protein EcfA2 [Parabacteroides sp. PM6-13]MDH6390597.1 thymidylate kinase [Parabacteroides sp. PFB2-12]
MITDKEKFLTILFRELNSSGLRYAVLRNYELLPVSTGDSDLDIWIKSEDYPLFNKIVKETATNLGAKRISQISDKQCPKIALMAILWGIQIDVYIGGAYHRGVPYLSEQIIAANVEKYNDIYVLNATIDGLMCFLKETLNNKKCREDYCIKAQQVAEKLTVEQLSDYLQAFSLPIRKRIDTVLREGLFSASSIQKIGIEGSKDLLSFIARLRYQCIQISKLHRLTRQPGYTIAFLGTDGAGKSTLIDKMRPILNEAFHNGVRYEHLRPNYIPSLAVFMGKKSKEEVPEICTDPHGAKPSGVIGSLIRLNYYLLDYTWGYFRKVFCDKSVKTHLWIFDRYFYDYINDPLRARISLPKWLLNFYDLFVPTPDLIVCVGTQAEIIHARKPELPLEEVQKQVETLKLFAEKNPKAVWVDTGCRIEESVTAAMDAILKMMDKRFGYESLN